MLQVIARSFMSLSLGRPIDNRSIDSPEDAFETTCLASCGTPDRWEDDAQGTLPTDCQRPSALANAHADHENSRDVARDADMHVRMTPDTRSKTLR